jgi:Fe-S oxidoreductase
MTYVDAGQNEVQRFQEAYRRMAPFYRPGAPSDGLGNITVPVEDLDLDTESLEWAVGLSRQADEGTFAIGCPDFTTNRAYAYAIELARVLCAPDVKTARALLGLLTDELETI